jgi:hypothetical protein
MSHLLLFHGNTGYANAPQYYKYPAWLVSPEMVLVPEGLLTTVLQ